MQLPKNFAVIFFTGVAFGEHSITLYCEESKVLYLSYVVRDKAEIERDVAKFEKCSELEVKSYE